MKALKFAGRLELVTDAPIPRRDGETLIRVLRAGICGTDLEITRGYAGFSGVPGHEFVGRVVKSPRTELVGRRVVGEINAGCGACDLCLAGDSRHCASRTVLGIKDRDGAFAEYLSLPDRNLFEVPDSINDDEAVFVEPLAAALNVLDQVTITAASRVAVLGDGRLAQLLVRVLARTSCDLVVVGKHPAKLELCKSVGAGAVRLEDARLEPGRFDVVVEATGSQSGLPIALDLVRPSGSVILKSTHHGETVLHLSVVVVNEIKLIGSRCGRFAPAVELLASHSIEVLPLVATHFLFDECLEAFEKASAAETLKVILQMSE